MTASAASVAAVQEALYAHQHDKATRRAGGWTCRCGEFVVDSASLWDHIAVAAADAAVEAALEEVIIHVRGFGDVGGVDASMIVGNLADVANGTIDAAQAHGHDVKRSTVRDLNGWLREAHATITVDQDHPMWHRFLRPSDEWPRADRIEPRP